jgi:hypothetical protein
MCGLVDDAVNRRIESAEYSLRASEIPFNDQNDVIRPTPRLTRR